MLDTNCVFGRWPQDARDASLERLLADLGDLGFERALTVSLRAVFDDPEAGNAETLAACARHPILVPVATLNPRRFHPGVNLPGKLAESGCVMLRLFRQHQGWSTESLVLERILHECAEAGLPVAYPVVKASDTASRLARIVPEGVRLVLSEVYYNALTECTEVLRRRRDFVLELGHTCAPGAIEFLCREFGADRLVLGTGQAAESARGALEELRRAEISDEERAAVLGGTAARLLKGRVA
jgi:predicted TIM-barrel fold metal-dependent hydrolase